MCLKQGSLPARNEAACWPGPRPQLPICSKEEKRQCMGAPRGILQEYYVAWF